MENILGIDSNLENDLSSIETTDALAESPNIEESAPIIPDYASKPQNLEQESNSQPKPDNFLSAINSAGQTLMQNRQADISKPTDYYNVETKERYKNDPSIYHDHFNPQSDNEKIAYENWDRWDAVSAGFTGFKDSFKTSFEEYFRYDRIAKAIFNLDVDYLAPTEGELDIAAYKQHLNEVKNPIYYAPGTENDILSKGFLAESIANLGFTFGTVSGIVLEQLGTKAIEAGLAFVAPETFGASAAAAVEIEAAADAKAAIGFGKIWKNLTTFFTGKALNSAELIAQETGLTANALREGKAVSTVDDIIDTTIAATNTAANGIKYGTKFWDNALNLASKVPFAGELADAARIYRAGKGILTTKELFQLGAGGLRRSIGEWQLAASEAAVEAGGAYKDHVDQLMDIYKEKNGTDPIGQDLLDIKNQALKVSTVDFGTNVAILGIMNKIQWGNLFGKFKAEHAIISKIRTGLGREADELGLVVVKNADKLKSYQKNYFGIYGVLPKIAKDFGTKQAAWEFGKDMVRGLTRLQITEGIQENLQEMTAVGVKDYYASIYKNDPTSWGKSFNVALESQMTKQGFKTFLSGALTGLFIGPAMHTVTHTMQAFDKQAKAHKQAVKESIEYLNQYYGGDSKTVLKEAVKHIKLQNMYNEGMIEGLTTNDKKQYNDNRDSALIQTVMHAKRTGTLNHLIAFIKGYGQMSSDEFKQAFNYSPEELKKGSAAEIMNELAASVQEYSDLYDKYQTKFGLLMSMEDLIKDPMAKEKFSVKRAALLDHISTVAFIHSKGNATVKRQASMRQNLGKYKTIGQSLNSAFSTLVSPDKIDDESVILNNEIKTLKDSLTGDVDEATKDKTLKLISEKEKEKGVLDAFKILMFKREQVEDKNHPDGVSYMYDTRNSESAKNTFPIVSQLIGEYLDIKNKQAGLNTKIDYEELNEAMQDIYDYIALGQDYEEYVDAVNFLNKPEVFAKHHERLMDARVAAHARLLYDEFEKLAEISSIGKKYKEDNKELLDKLLSFSKNPAGTYANMIELQKIRNQLTMKAQEIDEVIEKEQKEKEEQEKVEAEQKETRENHAKIAKASLPLDTMLGEAKDDDSIMQEVENYLQMRYHADELQNFPFSETDPKKRIITRYWKDYDGNEHRLDRRIVPMIIPGTNIPIDNITALYNYICILEEAIYDKSKGNTVTTNNAKTEEKTQELDKEKSNLANHVGNPVMLNGEKGILEIQDNYYVVKLSNGTVAKIAEVKEGESPSFDDFNELSIAYESTDEDTKSVVNPKPNPVVDTNTEGTVTISVPSEIQQQGDDITVDQYLNSLYINGVKWDIVRDESGTIIRFERTWKEKKKNGKGTVLRHESMSVQKGKKGADYAARVNALVLLVMRKLPETAEQLDAEKNALDNAIAEVQHVISTGKSSEDVAFQNLERGKQKSDERLAIYRLNKVKNEEIPDDILQIKAKFDHPFTRNQVSHDDMLKLFMWASDLVNAIKGDVVARLMVTHPVIWNAISELTKDYINPINDILNGKARNKSRSTKVTKRSAAEKKSVEKLVEELNIKPAESNIGKPAEKPKKQRVKKKKEQQQTVKEAVEAVQAEFDFDSTKTDDSILNPKESPIEDQIHELAVQDGLERIQTITPDKINMVMASVKPEESDAIIERARNLYIQMMAGKFITDFTPEEQRILDDPKIMDKATASIDFGDVVQANIKGTIPEIDKIPNVDSVPQNENPFAALMNNFKCNFE